MSNYGLQILRLLPEAILAVFGCAIMLAEPFVRRKHRLAGFAVVGLLCALGGVIYDLWAVLPYQATSSTLAFNGQIANDTFSVFFRALFILAGLLVVLASPEYLRRDNINHGEYYALVLLSILGQCLMAASVELVMIFIGLEISSIGTYVLAGFRSRAAKSSEASLKYFLLGSFATAFLLYGIALIFGATGTTELTEIARALRAGMNPMAAAGAALMFVGLGFKVAAAPFHVWTPDVYEGSPTPVSAFMSAGPKAAAFAVFLRVFLIALGPVGGWFWLLWISAVLSMFIGNLAAIAQTNIKRLLAYSSIAHAGYILVAFAARSELGIAAVLFYLAAYSVMNIGAFVVVSHFGSEDERLTRIDDYSGLGRRQPTLAALLTIFLLSLMGIPLTGGFFGKFYIFRAALDAHLVWLTILGVFNSAIAAYYYLRVIVVMYMREPAPGAAVQRVPAAVKFVLWASAAATFYLGIFPGDVLSFASRAAALLR
jgi:NADH-quinone oxidoreductase subunit N